MLPTRSLYDDTAQRDAAVRGRLVVSVERELVPAAASNAIGISGRGSHAEEDRPETFTLDSQAMQVTAWG